ncbi:MAG TPA: hypothetical protein PLI18_00510 [Pirellulaceae bacterium]|nr:hypothetical protein [Pirellulaceae bacterium]
MFSACCVIPCPARRPVVIRSALAILLLGTVAAIGCGGRGADAYPLDQPQAEAALRAWLDHWKSGKSPDGLNDVRPGLVVGDVDWNSGAKLKDYTIAETGFSDGTNWHIAVTLELERSGASAEKSEITYVVGTSPVETIFRK